MDLTAQTLALPGLAFALIAFAAWRGDRRRRTRSDPDAVGFVDWTTLSFFASILAIVLIGGALKLWLEG